MSAKEPKSTDVEAREISAALSEIITFEKVQRDFSLAPYTTFKVGGAADFFVEVSSERIYWRYSKSQINGSFPLRCLVEVRTYSLGTAVFEALSFGFVMGRSVG